MELRVNEIYQHPLNPRKDLGDLTELAESIKQNGIFQNLTVIKGHYLSLDEYVEMAKKEGLTKEQAKMNFVPGEYKDNSGYTVIIGHRRLAASKMAGLEVVPCTIAEMDDLQQQRVMLMENMQRADLTPYEQAKGFQLMIDLGSTVKDIAKDTGFSESTVRSRVKWASFDESAFKKASEHQVSIMEINMVADITDQDLQQKALAALGSANFRTTHADILRHQAARKSVKDAVSKLKEIGAEELQQMDWGKYDYCSCISVWNSAIPELNDGCDYYYIIKGDEEITIYKKKAEPVIDPEEERRKAEEKQRQLKEEEKIKALETISNDCYMNRIHFLKELETNDEKKIVAVASRMLMWSAFNRWSECSAKTMSALTGMQFDGHGSVNETDKDKFDFMKYISLSNKEPELMVLYQAFSRLDDGESYYKTVWDGGRKAAYKENADLNYIYDMLKELGYEMSDDEMQLRDGTHILFAEEKDDTNGEN